MDQQVPSSSYDAVAEESALYTLGLLDSRDRRRFETRLKAGCPFCAEQASACASTMGEAVAVSIAPVDPPVNLRSRLMSQVAGERETGRDMQVVRSGAEGWIAGPVAGSHFKALNGRKTFLLRLEPGITFPPHEHEEGAEQCLVIEGTATAAGVTILAGDFVTMPQGSYHDDLHSETGCTLLIAYA